MRQALLNWLGKVFFPDLEGESAYLQERKARAERRSSQQQDTLISLRT